MKLKINIPSDRFHCIYRGYGNLIVFVPLKGWIVKYDYYGFQFMAKGLDQYNGKFHNCRITKLKGLL